MKQLAKRIVDIATGQETDTVSEQKKNPAAVALGKLGGAKDGRTRAANLSTSQLSAIGKEDAAARWKGKRKR